MIVKTRIFELCDDKYGNLSELAHTMGISVSQIYRIRQGKRSINQKFIVGAIKAFPHYKLDELFYLTPESLEMTVPGREPSRRSGARLGEACHSS
jgi:transcriptional regulator with XRE-family HTH domain